MARRPYGTSVVEMRRYASFIATSNHKDLLTDPSGSRRFICIEVKGVIDTSRPIDYDQLYGTGHARAGARVSVTGLMMRTSMS